MGRKSHKNRPVAKRVSDRPPSKSDEPKCRHENEAGADNTAKLARSTSSAEGDNDPVEKSVFPKHVHWLVFSLTLAVRLWYVTTPANWWILHPDEIYQTMEVAHSEAFGYGFRPYEYMPPAGNDTFSTAHAEAAEIGMYSLRSFVLVHVISMVMLVADRAGVTSSPFLITKVFHAILTSCLPLAVYWFTKALYKSRDIATLSTIFTSLSVSLNVLGTHTLINSFISTFLFLSLIPLLGIVVCIRKELRSSPGIQSAVPKQINGMPSKCDDSFSVGSCKAVVDEKDSAGRKHIFLNSLGVSKSNGITMKCCDNDVLQRHSSSKREVCKGQGNGLYTLVTKDLKSYSANNSAYIHAIHAPNGHVAGDIYANGGEKDNTQLYNLHTYSKGRTKTPAANESSDAMGHIIKYSLRVSSHVAAGILFGLCIHIRTDTILILVVICLLFIGDVARNICMVIQDLAEYAGGICIGFAIGGYTDHVAYGVWFITVKQWFIFNIWSGRSSEIFGKSPSWFYAAKLANLEPLGVLGCSIILMDIIVTHFISRSNLLRSKHLDKNISFSFFILFFIYSFVGHKEYRFIHNAMVLLYISLSRAIFNLIQFTSFTKYQNGYQYYGRIIYFVLTVLCSSQFCSFLIMNNKAISEWAYAGKIGVDSNGCLDYLSKQNDVKGVFLDRSLYETGGYSILHQDVPLFATVNNEFREYDMKIERKHLQFFSHAPRVGISSFERISELISTRNAPYLAKVLIDKPQYNYMILLNKRPYHEVGYKEVFRTQTTKVIKRTFLREDEAALYNISDHTAMGVNATVLEYEGYWLGYYGLLKKAEKRLLLANRLDPTRLGPFKILMHIFRVLNSTQYVRSVLKACKEIHKAADCLKPYVPVRLDA